MTMVEALAKKVLEGGEIAREEALELYEAPLEELCHWANRIREKFCENGFDLCTIINAKSGRCSENCRFCSQSIHSHTASAVYPLLSTEDIVKQAVRDAAQGVLRFSIVTSGKRLTNREVLKICEAVKAIKAACDISVCVSLGLLKEEQFVWLKEAGVERVHNNLETSERNFPNVCTTHTFADKVDAILAAQRAGLPVCSGGIMGLGETVEDRIDMAISLRKLGIKSIPVNMLNAIEGTPFEGNVRLTQDELRRIVAVYRFILPGASIRLAGGRGLLADKGKSCFMSGANAAISGDMLTTAGITVATDKAMLDELGFVPKRCNG